jgi:hypothetical protein
MAAFLILAEISLSSGFVVMTVSDYMLTVAVRTFIKKHIAFAILDILTTYTDEDHILTAKEIMDLLKAKYNIEIERRTIYSNIDVLEQAGYVISKFDDNGKGYYLQEKQFDKAEILLLCNASISGSGLGFLRRFFFLLFFLLLQYSSAC